MKERMFTLSDVIMFGYIHSGSQQATVSDTQTTHLIHLTQLKFTRAVAKLL